MRRRQPRSTLFPYTTLFRSKDVLERALPYWNDAVVPDLKAGKVVRSEEHTSELQSRGHLVCRLLLEKKKNMNITILKNGMSMNREKTNRRTTKYSKRRCNTR